MHQVERPGSVKGSARSPSNVTYQQRCRGDDGRWVQRLLYHLPRTIRRQVTELSRSLQCSECGMLENTPPELSATYGGRGRTVIGQLEYRCVPCQRASKRRLDAKVGEYSGNTTRPGTRPSYVEGSLFGSRLLRLPHHARLQRHLNPQSPHHLYSGLLTNERRRRTFPTCLRRPGCAAHSMSSISCGTFVSAPSLVFFAATCPGLIKLESLKWAKNKTAHGT